MKITLNKNRNNVYKYLTASLLTYLALTTAIFAAEQSIHGIIDTRLITVDGAKNSSSYLLGGYGKFDNKYDSAATLAQLGISYKASWQNNFSINIVANAFSNKKKDNIGITEAFIHYKGLPNSSGWRLQGKAGFFYPTISLENNAVAWSNPNTLNNSTLNTWVAEELRNTGVQVTVEKLGKFTRSKHDFSLNLSLFQNNDTAGAMLTWHGWTSGTRQSLFQEKLKLQPFPARQQGKPLAIQAPYSDPFLELDNRWGAHIVAQWKVKNKQHPLKINLGYYNNNTASSIEIKGQYTWKTRFVHAGFKTKLAKKLTLLGQYMHGNTYMKGKYGGFAVNANFTSAFIMLRKYWQKHQIALRIEEFSVDDLDNTWGDNNQEYGKGLTLSYRYRLSKNNFIQSEYNWLQSNRPARWYVKQPIDLIERQLQLAFRVYF
ncbi:MAG: hypothetical protein COB35_00760 [Gammaproteobacteria bacterium]|nr:MAG: hypothetical protein COB35_00760 [Gammaproteobacteria bacterium]